MVDQEDLARFMGGVDAKLENLTQQVQSADSERLCVKKLVDHNAAQLSLINQKIDMIEPAVRDLQRLRWRFGGVLAATSVLVGGVAAFIGPIIRMATGL